MLSQRIFSVCKIAFLMIFILNFISLNYVIAHPCGSSKPCDSTTSCCDSTTKCCDSTTKCCESTTKCCESTTKCCDSTQKCCTTPRPCDQTTPTPATPCDQTTPTPTRPCDQTTTTPATTTTTTTTPGTTTTVKTFVCPNFTYWNGVSCQTSINIHNEIHNPTNIFSTNENKVFVYMNDSKSVVTATETITSPPTTIIINSTSPPPPTRPRCCHVYGPRRCIFIRTRWICENRKFNLCGNFCLNINIHLKPSQIFYKNSTLIMTPTYDGPTTCNNNTSSCSADIYDCYGCFTNGICPSYCFDYDCPNDDCYFQEQADFCQIYRGAPVCRNSMCFESVC